MEIIDFNLGCKKDCVMALGYFDAMHLGHKNLILTAKINAAELGVSTAVMAFTGVYKPGGDVFTFDERVKRIEKTGVDFVVRTELNKAFMEMPYQDFIKSVLSKYNVKRFVCGEDFTFGKNAEGNVFLLRRECKKYGVKLTVEKKILDKNGLKISTSFIKSRLAEGNVRAVNALLCDNYSIQGVVVSGKRVGKSIGFPTANILFSDDKFKIKSGVYKTFVYVNGIKYKSITNVGAQPTFNGGDLIVETYIDGFSGNLYGEKLTVYFEERLRDVIKFNSVEELTNQLIKDKESLND